jgi:ATP-dependent DNA helicase PIF1
MPDITPAPQITAEFKEALDLLEDSHQHVFVTGKAGTGKSTLLQYFRSTTSKKLAVLAPTGVAALNVQGQTIHSFFKFRPDSTPESVARITPNAAQAKLYKELEVIMIDEVSMLRADLLDCIDMFLRRHGPQKGKFFGGIQMLFFGDLYQLPPVLTSIERPQYLSQYKGTHFFHAKVIDQIPLYTIELTTVYRQQEEDFIEILNAIRTNQAASIHLETLNSQHAPEVPADGAITLTTTNDLADTVNQKNLAALPGEPFVWTASSSGTFTERDAPTPRDMVLKPDTQVMLLTNDPRGRWVNGSIGTVQKISRPADGPPLIHVLLTDGTTVQVPPFTWEVFRYAFNERTNALEQQTAGSYTQYPLRLAWAVTIHKSQGKTFDQVVIDLGRGTFSPGQLYVALSRCRTLDGITLRQPIQQRHIMSDPSIHTFSQSFKDGFRQHGQASLGFDDW